MRYLTFALGKGRLAKQTLELFERIGITCEEMKDPDSRKLIFTNEELRGFVKDLTGYGLTGVEVYYPGHDAPRRDFLHQLSRENHLIETGGSDFHGDNKPGLSVGTGYNGTLHVPDACFENLAAACAAARNATEGT